jgi:hypothetical protein
MMPWACCSNLGLFPNSSSGPTELATYWVGAKSSLGPFFPLFTNVVEKMNSRKSVCRMLNNFRDTARYPPLSPGPTP